MTKLGQRRSKTLQSARFSGIDRRLDETEQRLEDAEQYSRMACHMIYGIPLPNSFESAADCLSKVKEVFEEIDIEVPDGVINWAHRIGRKEKIIQL